MAAAEVAVSRDDLKKAENQVALQVHALYFGILIARLQKQAAEQQSAYAGEHLRESEEDVRNGSCAQSGGDPGPCGRARKSAGVLTADLQLSDLTMELNDLLGLPLDTRLELDPAVPASFDQRPREEYVQAHGPRTRKYWRPSKPSRRRGPAWPPQKRPTSPTSPHMRAIAIRTACRFWYGISALSVSF